MEIKQEEYIMKRWEREVKDGILYTFTDIDGINFPFQLYIPFKLSDKPDIVLAMRTPREQNNLSFDDALKECALSAPNPLGRLLSYGLGNICLMPVIPRVGGIQSSYLAYYTYHNDFDKAFSNIEKGRIKFTKEDVLKFTDLDKQIYMMIQTTMDYLKTKGINVDNKVIASGYSAAAKFVTHFAALHTDIVKAIVAGGTGGNHIIPDKSLDLLFPLGVSDIPNFDEDAFKKIQKFYFVGDNDYNDLTCYLPKYEEDEEGNYLRDFIGNRITKRNDSLKGYHEEERDGKVVLIPDYVPFDKIDFDLDKDGNYQLAYTGYYTLEQVTYIINNIGDNVQTRFDKMKEIYNDLGVNGVFKKYPGDHATVFDNQELYTDVESFINNI